MITLTAKPSTLPIVSEAPAGAIMPQEFRHLLTHHLAALRKRGLGDEIILASRVYSETVANKLASILDWNKVSGKLTPAIVIPFFNAQNQNGYSRVRPDRPRVQGGRAIKYESPKGQPNQIYIPPGIAEVLDDPERELMFTEGEFKARQYRNMVSLASGWSA